MHFRFKQLATLLAIFVTSTQSYAGSLTALSNIATSPQWHSMVGVGLNIVDQQNSTIEWYTMGRDNFFQRYSTHTSPTMTLNTDRGSVRITHEQFVYNNRLTDSLLIDYDLSYPPQNNGSAFLLIVGRASGIDLLKGSQIPLIFNLDSNVIASNSRDIHEEVVASIFKGDIFTEHTARPFLSVKNERFTVIPHTISTPTSTVLANASLIESAREMLSNLRPNHAMYLTQGSVIQSFTLDHTNHISTEPLVLTQNVNHVSFQISVRLPYSATSTKEQNTRGQLRLFNLSLQNQ